MIAPIPRYMLNDTAIFYKRLTTDAYGKGVFAEAVPLTFINVEFVSSNSLRALGEFKDDKLLIFYDLINSEPLDVVFSEKDKIVFEGRDYFVRTCEPLQNHHYEIYLT